MTSKKVLERRAIKKAFKEWADKVKERDGHKCVICGDSKMLNAHHLIPREVKEFRFDIMNGISLCPKHHQFSRDISAHSNSFDFMLWLLQNRMEQFSYLAQKRGYKWQVTPSIR